MLVDKPTPQRQGEKHYGDLLVKRKERMLFEQRHPEVLESTPGGMIAKALEVLRNELAEALIPAKKNNV